jgi:hypothetical protein
MRLKTTKASLLAGLMGVMLSGTCLAGDVYVIANSGVELAAAEVKEVYLGEKQLAGSVKLVPVDNAAVQADFLDKVVGMDAGKYSALWTKKGFRDGLAAPAVKSGDAEVISFVKSTPGAVGYVSAPASGVKAVHKY